MLAVVYNNLIDLFISAVSGFNATIEPMDSAGRLDPATGQYDGCHGKLQRNQTDYYAGYTSIIMPDVIKPLAPDHETSFLFLSMYRMAADRLRVETSVLDFVDGFDADLWLLTAFTLLLLTIILLLALRLEQQRLALDVALKRPFRNQASKASAPLSLLVTACVVKQVTSLRVTPRARHVRRLLFLLTIACFFLSFYLTSDQDVSRRVPKAVGHRHDPRLCRQRTTTVVFRDRQLGSPDDAVSAWNNRSNSL